MTGCLQVYCMDFYCCSVSSSKFSVYGVGFEDEFIIVFDAIHLFDSFSSGLPCYIPWPMVCWPCFSCSWKET